MKLNKPFKHLLKDISKIEAACTASLAVLFWIRLDFAFESGFEDEGKGGFPGQNDNKSLPC